MFARIPINQNLHLSNKFILCLTLSLAPVWPQIDFWICSFQLVGWHKYKLYVYFLELLSQRSRFPLSFKLTRSASKVLGIVRFKPLQITFLHSINHEVPQSSFLVVCWFSTFWLHLSTFFCWWSICLSFTFSAVSPADLLGLIFSSSSLMKLATTPASALFVNLGVANAGPLISVVVETPFSAHPQSSVKYSVHWRVAVRWKMYIRCLMQIRIKITIFISEIKVILNVTCYMLRASASCFFVTTTGITWSRS